MSDDAHAVASTEADSRGEAPPGPVIQVVPVKGLPIVAAIVVLLIVAIAENWQWALDWYHVAGGGLWTGIDLFVGLVLGPILARLSIPARAEFSARFLPKMVLIMPTLVVMTLAAGFQLAIDLGNLAPSNPNHGWLVASFAVVGVMSVIAVMSEFAFVHNHAGGAPLVVVTLMLVMFAITIPTVIAFTVARYQVVPRIGAHP